MGTTNRRLKALAVVEAAGPGWGGAAMIGVHRRACPIFREGWG